MAIEMPDEMVEHIDNNQATVNPVFLLQQGKMVGQAWGFEQV